MSSSSSTPTKDGFETIWVKAWSSHTIPVHLLPSQVVSYEFKTEAYDIGFELKFQPRVIVDEDDLDEDEEVQAEAEAEVNKELDESTRAAIHAEKERQLKEKSEKSKSKDKAAAQPTEQVIVAANRINKADQVLQHGEYTCAQAGTLLFIFDNTYSKMRGKSLLFKLNVQDAQSNRERIPLGETRLTTFGPAVVEGRRDSDGIYVVRLPFGQGYFAAETLMDCPNIGATSVNDRCIVGVDLFFNNKVVEAEDFFKKEIEHYPIFSLAYSTMGFLKALMTWEKGDIAEANARLKQTRHFVAAFLPQESTLGNMARFVTRQATPIMNHQEMEATLITAEAYLLNANLLLTEESILSYMKAGLKIRSGWKLYDRCFKQVTNLSAEDSNYISSLDISVLGGIQFGIGAFNVCISILPQIILKIVSAMGFPSDREKGLAYLQECSTTNGVRSPLAALTLLFIYIVIPSFFTVRSEYHIEASDRIFEETFKKYPDGALFWWMRGRQQRMRRDLPQAIYAFNKAADGQPLWLQLQHLCAYELAWCHFFSLKFEESRQYWSRLEKESSWSKAFFMYMQAMCIMSSQQIAEVTRDEEKKETDEEYQQRLEKKKQELVLALFSRVEDASQRKFGGRTISIEQFVCQRAKAVMTKGRKLILPALEMIYLFYGFIQMNDELLATCLQEVNSILAAPTAASLSMDDLVVCQLVQASILKALRRTAESEKILRELVDEDYLKANNLPKKKDSDLQEDKYLLAFARFELGALLLEKVYEADKAAGYHSTSSTVTISKEVEAARQKSLDEAVTFLKKAENTKHDYHFKNRLHMRIHLASVETKMMRSHWENEKIVHPVIGAVEKKDSQTEEKTN